MHEIMEFCVTSSLALDNWEQKILSTSWQWAKPLTPCAARTIIFQRENLNYSIVCFTQCTLFFQKVCFLLLICLPSVICGSYVTKINAVLWHSALQTFASLGLFTFASIAYLLQLWIKKSELNYSRLKSGKAKSTYLGDAQITRNLVKSVRNGNSNHVSHAFHSKMAWPPPTYDVIFRNHSNWPSLNLSQNTCEG